MRKRKTGRPVSAITTIEGVIKTELQNRCVQISLTKQHPTLLRGPIEAEIHRCRNEIYSAMVLVIARYLAIRKCIADYAIPRPTFAEHFIEISHLLHAHAEISGKPDGWADKQIKNWNIALAKAEPVEDDLEHLISHILDSTERERVNSSFCVQDFTHEGRIGKLFITTSGELLIAIRVLGVRDMKLPQTPQALSRRLNSGNYQSFTVFKADSLDIPELARTDSRRPIALFRPE